MRILCLLIVVCLFILAGTGPSSSMYIDLTKEEIQEAVEFGARYPGYLWIKIKERLDSSHKFYQKKYEDRWWPFGLLHNSWEAFYRIARKEWGPCESYYLVPHYFGPFDVNASQKAMSLEAIVATPFLRAAAGAAGFACMECIQGMRTEEGQIDWYFRGSKPDKRETSEELIEKIMNTYFPDQTADELEREMAQYRRKSSSFYQSYLFILLHVNQTCENFPQRIKPIVRYQDHVIDAVNVSFRQTYRASEGCADRIYYVVFPRKYEGNNVISETEVIRLDVWCDDNLTHCLFFDLSKMR